MENTDRLYLANLNKNMGVRKSSLWPFQRLENEAKIPNISYVTWSLGKRTFFYLGLPR